MRYAPMPIALRYTLLPIMLMLGSICEAQEPIKSTTKVVEIKDLPKGIITYTQSGKYPSLTFYFHNDKGDVVKTIREDQFPINNPVFKLNLPKNTKVSSLYYYLPFKSNGIQKEVAQVSVAKKVKVLKSLSKHGLQVKKPETAASIIGSPISNPPTVTDLHNKYLVRCETATIHGQNSKDSTDLNGNTLSNSLLDCSYLTVYNHMGVVVQNIQIPGKRVKIGWVSEDGKYLFCSYNFGFLWDEGPSTLPGGFLMIDLRSKIITELHIPEFKEYTDGIYGFFADGYFQMGFGPYDFLYVNPYNRVYYTIKYRREEIINRKGASAYSSFMPYEGLKIDLSRYAPNAY